MKKKYNLIIFFVCILQIINCEDDNEKFNYYQRYFDGTYELKNIGYTDDIKFDLFSYEYKKNSWVKGFYYKSERVKFIDILLNNKISKTIYYDYDTEKPIYQKTYDYTKSGILRSMEVKSIYDESLENNRVIRFVFIQREDGFFNYYAYRYGNWQNGVGLYSYSEGLFDKNFRPLNITSNNIEKTDSKIDVKKIIEKFKYRNNGYTYYLYMNKIRHPIFIKTETQENENTYINVNIYNLQGEWYESYLFKKFKDHEILITQDFYQSGFVEENSKIILEKELMLLKPKDQVSTYDSVLISNDEKVYFKDGEFIKSLLILYFDIYYKNYLFEFPFFSDKQFIVRKYNEDGQYYDLQIPRIILEQAFIIKQEVVKYSIDFSKKDTLVFTAVDKKNKIKAPFDAGKTFSISKEKEKLFFVRFFVKMEIE